MRFLKTLVLILIGFGLVIVGIGNMAPVDFHLVPSKIAGSELAVKQIPLAVIIMVSVLIGLVIGQLMEWLREGKHRRMSNDRGREVAKLRNELEKARVSKPEEDDDLPRIPVR